MKTLVIGGGLMLVVWIYCLWTGHNEMAIPFGAIGGFMLGVASTRSLIGNGS